MSRPMMAVSIFDEQAMRALVGSTSGGMEKTADEWLDETRGPADDEKRRDSPSAASPESEGSSS